MIGSGGFGHVYLGMNLDTGELLAVRQLLGFCDLVIWFALSTDLKSFVTLSLSPLFDFLFQL